MKLKLDQLVVTKENPRITPASAASFEALMASLASHGLIQPIVVRENGEAGKYEVIAGSRRFAAAKKLGWEEVECVENDAEYGVGELGAAENMLREAMHPLDECKVISRLVADGESMADVAGRFGQTEKWTEQRMALNALCPEVQKCFRNGLITMAAAQAFTLADKPAQKDYLLKAKEWQLSPEAIRRHFLNTAIPGHYALFDLELYPKGSLRTDLFGEGVLFEDREKFHELQLTAIATLKETLMGEGWGDVVQMLKGADHTISSRYVRTEGRILKADRGKLTCLVTYTPATGAVVIEKGVALRKESKAIKAGKNPEDDTTKVEEVEDKTADDLSRTQLEILAACQTNALEKEIAAGNYHLALMTLAGPLLGGGDDYVEPSWCAGRIQSPNYIGVNAMLTMPIEIEDDTAARYKLPGPDILKIMKVKDLGPLLCNLALRSMKMVGAVPRADASKALKAAEVSWVEFDEGFLSRYRTDQLEDLADRLGLERDGLKKAELVTMIAKASVDLDLDKVLKLDLK